MRSFIIFCVIIVSATSDNFTVFRKCCPRGKSLIKLTGPDVSMDDYQCIENYYETIDKNFTNPSSPLVVDESIVVEHGLPEGCDLQMVHLNIMELLSTNETQDICYDRMVLEIENGTIQNDIPKTVILKCNDTELSPTLELQALNIRKCCPKGQLYDTEYHMCRKLNSVSPNEEWFIEWLNLDYAYVYEFDNGLHCKLNEYAVELKDQQFRFEVNDSALSVYKDDVLKGHTVAKGSWCLDQEYSSKGLVARVCTSDCGAFGAYCLRKCCPIDQHYLPFHCGSPASKCAPNTDENVLFNISRYMEPVRSKYHIGDVLGIRSEIICKTGKTALNNSLPMDRHSLTMQGHLNWALGTQMDYCLEAFDTRKCTDDVQMITVMCFVKPPQVKDFRVSFALNCISAICLALTLLVYCMLPELRNLHGLNLICHISTMLFAYSCLARVQYKMVDDRNLCTALGYGIYFGFVAAFAWLNVMCFDIWCTFGSVRAVQRIHKSNAEKRRFLWYSLYAWGSSLSLTLVTYLLDRFPITPILDANIGQGMCWFGSIQNAASDWPHYIFFVIPMGLVSGVNFILWALTANHCRRVKAEVHRLQAGSVGDRAKRRFRIDKANFALTGKLWVVMGAGWISELISTIFANPDNNVLWLFTVIDMVNELQGVFIFCILIIFKPKLYKLARKKLGLEKPDPKKTTSSGRTSSTFLSRTISTDERTHKRVSVPTDNDKIH